MKYVLISSLFVLLATLFPLKAQERLELNVDAAVAYAIQNNKQLRSASLGRLEAQASHRATITQGLPQLEAAYDYQNFLGAEANLGPMVFEFTPTSNLNIRASQLIFSGSYIVGIQLSKLLKEISKVNYKRTDAEIRAQVINTYNLILISERSKDILLQNVENLREVKKRTASLVAVGILEETDRDQITVQLTMLENAVRTAERQTEMAYNLLRMHLGASADTDIVLTETLLQIMAAADIDRTLNTPFDINKSFDYQLMQLQRDIASRQLAMERVNFLPTAAGFYNYTEKIEKPELDFQPTTVVGINVSIPLFTSGTRYFNQAKARYNLQSVENQVALVADQLLIQERQLRYNLQNAFEQYETQQKNIELAQRVYNNIYLKYQQGLASSLDVTTSNTNLLQAENDYVMTIMQVLEAKTELDILLNKHIK